MKERLLFVHFPVKPEEQALSSLPTHLTILSWFDLDIVSLPGLLEETRDLVRSLEPIQVVIGEEEMFGDHNDIPAMVVRHGMMLPELHTNLLDIVQEIGGQVGDLRWSGPNYRPHVSRKRDLSLQTGDWLTIREMSLVRAVSVEPKAREIVESYQW